MEHAATKGKCAVFDDSSPTNHHFCDKRWLDSAMVAWLAARCGVCGIPKALEKLRKAANGRMLCATHSELQF
ncbi:hypothetical protein [Candidatus Chlorohelix sp.]|uniref:hypothetical protein n=1 Tax=Candidatus Chlorohelix sp. TaxID=3139201 RepID=UPI003036CBE8